MSRCNSCCSNERFECLCHKKERRNCTCPKEKCHCETRLVKDCVCVEWSVQQGGTQTIFSTGGFRSLFASGFISFDCGCSDGIIARFFLKNQQVGSSIRIFEESSVAFSFTRFDQITVECPTCNVNCQDACEGEICITTRFPV